jgi:hypothetical protein
MIDVAQLCQAMRMGRIRRREFVQLLAGSAVAASIGVAGRGAWAADTALVFT